MLTYPSYIRLVLLFTITLGAWQCAKEPENTPVEIYPETTLEENAGNWKMYLAGAPSEIPVAAPAAADSPEYLAELETLKGLAAQLTDSQKSTVQYWGGNGVLRWHEVAREMAALYNVPPDNNADGTYPTPDPLNPLSYPRFPFANPPYTSRALALLAVAQYDALVTVWHYKFAHRRLAPAHYDSAIRPLIPVNDLPSYPSEDAAVAAASQAVLSRLFPGETASLSARAEEHRNSRLWAGANTSSDIAAGAAIGAAIAEKVLAYAQNDKMSTANKQADYPLLLADARSRGLQALWTSRDIPARPPMLPFFGKVKTWHFDQAALASIRPPLPPLPGESLYASELEEVKHIATHRTREQFRIAAFWADGPGSYTPPGHWNRIAAELVARYRQNEVRSARTMALLCTAVHDAGVSCWEAKYYYLTPRPTEMDSRVTTSTGIPNFPAYPSGHSTFSAAAAEMLTFLFPEEQTYLWNMANEASESRIMGGIHFRSDCQEGLLLGTKTAGYAVQRAQSDGG